MGLFGFCPPVSIGSHVYIWEFLKIVYTTILHVMGPITTFICLCAKNQFPTWRMKKNCHNFIKIRMYRTWRNQLWSFYVTYRRYVKYVFYRQSESIMSSGINSFRLIAQSYCLRVAVLVDLTRVLCPGFFPAVGVTCTVNWPSVEDVTPFFDGFFFCRNFCISTSLSSLDLPTQSCRCSP